MAISNKNYIKRHIFDKVAKHLKQEEMTILLGPRQVGKTVLLEQLRDDLTNKEKIDPNLIFYYNLDIIKDWETVKEQTQFIKFLKARTSRKKIYVFIDEAQRVQNPGRFFKGVYDSRLNAKIILTGSSSLELASQIRESLAGRKRIFYIYPFSFLEFLSYKDKILYQITENNKKLSLPDRQELNNIFKDYVVWGGYPRVVLSESAEERRAILSDIFSSYVERDIIGFLKVKNKAKFSKLVKLLAGQIGQLINIDELASNVEIDRETVYRYLTALEETYIISLLTPYFRNPRQEIIKSPKVYFIDNGIKNYLLDNFKSLDDREDKGSLFENSVFKELFSLKQEKSFELHFWRTKLGAEVDFIVEQGKALTPIEVKFNIKTSKVASGLRSFIKKYQPNQAMVVNLGLEDSIEIEKTRVQFFCPNSIMKILSEIKNDLV